MSARKKTSTRFDGWLFELVMGVGTGVLVCIGMLMLLAMVIESADVPHAMIFPLAIAAAAVGAFFAGMVAALLARRNGLLFGLACGAVLFLLILLAGFARRAGVGIGSAAVKLAVLLLTGGIGGVLGVNLRKK